MKKISVVLICICFALALTSCERINGLGPTVTQTRNVTGFTAVQLSIPAEMVYTQAANYNVEILGQKNILDEIESVVVNGELRIRFKNSLKLKNYSRLVVNVSCPTISALQLNGPGEIVAVAVNSTDMKLGVSGSGHIRIDGPLKCSSLEAVISGSGNILVNSGTSTIQTIAISGSGTADLQNVPSVDANVEISGSGSSWVNAGNKIDARISGSGNIYYKGNPIIIIRTSGSGRAIHL